MAYRQVFYSLKHPGKSFARGCPRVCLGQCWSGLVGIDIYGLEVASSLHARDYELANRDIYR